MQTTRFLLKRLIPYLRPHLPWAFAALALITLSSFFGLLTPWPVKIIVDNVLGGSALPAWMAVPLGSWADQPRQLLILVVLAYLALAFVQRLIDLLNGYVKVRLDNHLLLDLRSDLFQHAQKLSLAYHSSRRIGDTLNRINNQSAAIGQVALAFLPLTQSLITLVGMFWVAYLLDATLALLSLVVVPFIYYAIGYYAKRIEPSVREVRQMEADSLSIVSEAMSMLRVILAFGRERHTEQRFTDHSRRSLESRLRLTLRQTTFSFVVGLLAAAGTALVLGVGALHVLDGKLTVGLLLVVMTYIGSVYTPLQVISGTLGALQERLVDLKLALEVLDIDPEIDDLPQAYQISGATRGEIRYQNVSFSYDGRRDTLTDIAFTVQPGETVAVVGPTGAGKTTLLSLLMRFYAPQQGRILLDGRDIRMITLRSLRQQISLVTQEPLLFSGSVADNIRFADLEASQDAVEEAARAAHAHDFIERLPQGYDTQVGELGSRLSTGEKQRLCIARAFLKDAPILILDEPTASVDMGTEAVILKALDRLRGGRTTFMIAHRLSTVRRADRIMVLEDGRICESGPHEELVSRGGPYQRMLEAR
ncbi:MAG TPA: ABC transporter ATP-binding protein [Acidobacteriota bacterium]|nr:ABC transporter ATP-binding protein [Acidobacteriota bacterium]